MKDRVGGQGGLPDLGEGRGSALRAFSSLLNPSATTGGQRLSVVLPQGQM